MNRRGEEEEEEKNLHTKSETVTISRTTCAEKRNFNYECYCDYFLFLISWCALKKNCLFVCTSNIDDDECLTDYNKKEMMAKMRNKTLEKQEEQLQIIIKPIENAEREKKIENKWKPHQRKSMINKYKRISKH